MTSTGSLTDNHDDRPSAPHAPERCAVALAAVADAIARMRYGAVQLTIHDGRVVQLDVTERQRFI
jgi:hypothetical protein